MDELQFQQYIIPSLVSIFLLWSINKFLRKPAGNKNPPPSPPKLPIIGNLHQLSSLPHQDLQFLARKHGPLMLLHFGRVPVLIVSSAKTAREIMRTQDVTFSDRPVSRVHRRCFYDCKDVAFSPYGDYWRQAKSHFVLKLLTNKRVQSFRSIREEETALFVKKIGESIGSVNLSELFPEFSFDGICRSAFGRKLGESENGNKKFPFLVRGLSEVVGAPDIGEYIPWLSWISRVNGLYSKVEMVAKGLDDFLEGVIDERLQVQKEKDIDLQENFVDIMLEVYKDKSADVSIDRDSIKGLILDAFAAGTETTPIVWEWAMAELLRNPTVMDKLQSEIRQTIKGKHDITDDDLEKMYYLKAVIKETLRCHPPFPLLLPRRARADANISGYNVASGTLVMVNVWAIGRDPALWDEPEKFKPERFLNSSIDFKGVDFELIPFGAGRRVCPGITYSMAIIELLLANLLLKFNWKLPNGAEGKDLDMTEKPGISTRKAIPLLAVATSFPNNE